MILTKKTVRRGDWTWRMSLAILTQYRHVADIHTDRHTTTAYRASIALRGKRCLVSESSASISSWKVLSFNCLSGAVSLVHLDALMCALKYKVVDSRLFDSGYVYWWQVKVLRKVARKRLPVARGCGELKNDLSKCCAIIDQSYRY